jgi:hypothetical protein
MKKFLILAIGLLILGCGSRTEVTTISDTPIKLTEGLYVKEFVLGQNSASATRYIFVQCDAEGNIISGLSSSNISGKVRVGTTVVIDPEYSTYQKLKEKYGEDNELFLYLKLKSKYEQEN